MYTCILCDYSTNRRNDWKRHIATKKHNCRHEQKKERFMCYQCYYGTSRRHNLVLHLKSKKHYRNYLNSLLASRKVSEQWEQHLVGKRASLATLEIQKFIKWADITFSFETSLWRLLLLPVKIRPIVVVSDNYFIVNKRNSWTRLDRLSFLLLLKRITADHVNEVAYCSSETYLLAAVVWASKPPSSQDLSIISKLCVEAVHGELLGENAACMQDFISEWQERR